MSIKVLMKPHLLEIGNAVSGIHTVIRKYFQHLPEFGIELVDPDATSYDVTAAHAGITGSDTMVCHAHGLYWSADVPCDDWEWHVNSRVIEACRNAKIITVPSEWVAESFRRDMRLNPAIIPHGIDWQEWQRKEDNQGYVLWNKNRNGLDVCDNSILDVLMRRFPNVNFVSTFATRSLNGVPYSSGMWPKNFKIIETGGKTPHDEMKSFIQRSGVYLSTAKETFGISVLESMAAGVPILGWNWGGNMQLVKHGINGYLAEPNNVEDLCEGLNFCLRYRKTLGANGRELAKEWTWARAGAMVADVYRLALQEEPATVSVVIPVYHKSDEQVKRAIDSAINQTLKPDDIFVVIDEGYDKTYSHGDTSVHFIYQHNQGVANARNNGISHTSSKYICCLDADDWLDETFLEICVRALESDRSLGIAYTGLRSHNQDGGSVVSPWPGAFNPDKQLSYPKQNQVPTTCVFRREAWVRVGGYRARYCPLGAGSEDAALWSAICSIGYNAKKVTNEALFNYSMHGGFVHDNPDYSEIDWLSMYPWAKDGQHPFASVATPKRYSHPVRQYDRPDISVIIPVGPGHEKEVANALDSLEMQHFRRWEAIVVWDIPYSAKDENPYIASIEYLENAYPYIRLIENTSTRGAGTSRNLGVSIARAPLIFFLDADDVLADAHAFDKMLAAWNQNEAIIYSDYVGKAQWDYDSAVKEFGDKLLSYNTKKGTAVFAKQSADYDSDLAQRQPEHTGRANMPYYHWCLVSVLMPKAWHNAIGGFDESMETWEDVEYMWRLARRGYCFYRVSEPLVMYSYIKGHRREASAVNDAESLQKHQKMIQYIRSKFEGIELVACGCAGSKRQQQITATQVNGEQAVKKMADTDTVLIEFDFPGSDKRSNYGKALISPTGQTNPVTGQRFDYNGYGRKVGDRFLVHVADQRARPDMFKIVSEIVMPEVAKEPLREPELLVVEKRRGRPTKVTA